MKLQASLAGIPRASAFALFAEQINAWWPTENRHTRDPASTLHLLASGRFFERATDGRELELGKVREWRPPQRILLDLYIATAPERPTVVEVNFDAEENGTLVSIRQGPTAESAALWVELAPRFELAWGRVLKAYGRFASDQSMTQC